MIHDICVFDFDNTICDVSENRLSPGTEQLMRSLGSRCRRVLCTGRPVFLVEKPELFAWDAEIYYNGQLCLADHTVIFRSFLPDESVHLLNGFIKEKNLECVSFSDQAAAASPLHRIPVIGNVTGYHIKYGDPPSQKGVYKLVVQPCSALEEFMIKNQLPVVLSKWHHAFWEISPKQIDKSTGVQKVLEYWGVSWDRVAAFGDNENDVPLFQKAAVSTLLNDQRADLAGMATYIAPPFHRMGLDWAVKHYFEKENAYESHHP